MNTKNKNAKRLLLNCREAAYSCGIDPRTWRNWHQRGLIPPPVRVGKAIFWRADELVRWVEADCPRRDEWAYK